MRRRTPSALAWALAKLLYRCLVLARRWGGASDRAPNAPASERPLFDARWYARAHPEARGGDPYDHYNERGRPRGDRPRRTGAPGSVVPRPWPSAGILGVRRQVQLMLEAHAFDHAWYRRAYGVPAWFAPTHYVLIGAPAGFDPSPLFSSLGYYTANPDVAASGISALAHYILFGVSEGRLGGLAATAEPAARKVLADPVRRRKVFFVPGYDPRGTRFYSRLIKRELAKWARANGVEARVTRAGASASNRTAWRIEARWPDAAVTTDFDILAWNDLAVKEREMSPIRRAVAASDCLGYAMVSGGLWDIMRFAWRPAFFALYPWVMVCLYALVAAAWLAACWWTTQRHPGATAALAGAAAAVVGLLAWVGVLRRLDQRFFVVHALNGWIWEFRQKRGLDAAAAERVAEFAAQIAAAATPDTDEILVICHSAGAGVGTIALARALEDAPALGRRGPRLSLLTIGSTLVYAAGGRIDTPARRAAAALAGDARVTWLDYYAHQDFINYPRMDYPGLLWFTPDGSAPRNPIRRSARLEDLVELQRFKTLRWRWFELHFRYLYANEAPGEYDFYRFILGRRRLGSGLGALEALRQPVRACAPAPDVSA